MNTLTPTLGLGFRVRVNTAVPLLNHLQINRIQCAICMLSFRDADTGWYNGMTRTSKELEFLKEEGEMVWKQ